jgi:hypothetical protein
LAAYHGVNNSMIVLQYTVLAVGIAMFVLGIVVLEN